MACVYWIHLPEHTDIRSQGYIGYTHDEPRQRWNMHKFATRHGGRYVIHNAIRKHGPALKFDILVIGEREYCLDIERKLRPAKGVGWNIAVGGNQPSKSIPMTLEHKEKMRISRIGCWTLEARERQSLSHKGKVLSAEHRLKISQTRKDLGFPMPEDHRQKIISVNRGNTYNLGKKRSPEVKEKFRQIMLAKPDVTCPHCGVVGAPNIMKRWHLDRCRAKT